MASHRWILNKRNTRSNKTITFDLIKIPERASSVARGGKITRCAVKPRPLARGYKARGLTLVWRLLLLDVRSQNLNRCPSARCCEVRWRPQDAFPVSPLNIWTFQSQQPTRNTLEAVHQRRDGMLGRIVHEQVNVIVLAVHFDKCRLEVSADLLEDDSKAIDGVCVKIPSFDTLWRRPSEREVETCNVYRVIFHLTLA